ncbi:MAG: hypothetical protein GX970_11050, partial [Phyllobacteriaceae bacterium]|nr:hypothetical protein [Phyllobacteriaceae bacterium]
MKPLALVATLALAGVAGYGLFSVPAFQQTLSANDQVPNHFIMAPPAVTGAVAQPFGMLVAQASSPIDTLLAQLKPEEAPATTPAPAPAPRSSNAKVDESALRYFAQQGDTVRLQREIERLRALYPGWQPPADPLADDYVPDPDITEIWELYSKGDYAGARAAIEAKQAKDPTFSPTEDLQSSLALGEAGQRLRIASESGNYAEVIAIAANHEQLLVCHSVDNLWRLAQAFIAVGTPNRALDAYRYILTTCTDTAERYSTMQKAIENFDRKTVEELLALEKPGPSGVGEFAALRVDLARSAIAAALEEGGAEPSQEDISIFEAALAQTDAPEDMRLLGYFELDRNRPNEARRLFQRAYDS